MWLRPASRGLRRGGASAVPALSATKVVGLGDSLTSGAQGQGQSWPLRLAGLTGLTTVNQGSAGKPAKDMDTDFATITAPQLTSGSALGLLAGTNDIAFGAAGTNTATAVQGYLTSILTKAAGFPRLVCALPARDDVNWSPAKETERLALNAWLRANWRTYAEYFCDLAATFNNASDAILYDPDKLHHTRRGYQLQAELIRQAFNVPILGGSDPTSFIVGRVGNVSQPPTVVGSTATLNNAGDYVITNRPILGKKIFGAQVTKGTTFAALGAAQRNPAAQIGFDRGSTNVYSDGSIWTWATQKATAAMPYPQGTTVWTLVDDDLALQWWTIDGVNFYGNSTTARSAADVANGIGGLPLIDAYAVSGAMHGAVGTISGDNPHIWQLQSSYPWTPPSGFTQI